MYGTGTLSVQFTACDILVGTGTLLLDFVRIRIQILILVSIRIRIRNNMIRARSFNVFI